MTEPNPEIVAVLLDVDDLTAWPDIHHRDGTPCTPREVELAGRGTLAELDACADLARAETGMAAQRMTDHDRFSELVFSVHGWATVGEALGMLPPAERAEAEQIAARLWPDGRIYPGQDF